MTAFIRQEALEKAREIHLKADEEFAIEKSKLVREETASIDAKYEKKFKQASMSQQITRSTMSNKTRLKVLSARQDLLDKLFGQARSKLMEQGKKGDYEKVLQGLILECMYLMCEKKIGLRCRKADKDKVQSAAKKAAEEYKKNMSSEVETVLDEKNWLPDESYVLSPTDSLTCLANGRLTAVTL
jgi:V-type H+-transporting ATPase subunit E